MAKNPWDDLPEVSPAAAKNPWDDLPEVPPEEPAAPAVEAAPADNMAPLRALAGQGRAADLQAVDALGNFFSLGGVPALTGAATKAGMAARNAWHGGTGVVAGPGAQPSPDDTPEVRAAKEAFLAQQGEELTPYATASAATKARSEELRAQNPAFYTGLQLAPLAAPVATLAPLGGAILSGARRFIPGVGTALRTMALGKEGKAIAQGAREAEALAKAGPQGLTKLQQLALSAPRIGAAAGGAAIRGGLTGAAAGGLAGDEALARGDVGGFLKSLAAGGAAGGTLAGLGGAATGAAGELGKISARGVAKAETKIAEKAAEKQAKAVASSSGELGRESASTLQKLRALIEASQDETIDPALRKEAADILASPDGIALREFAYRNTIRDTPGQVGRTMAKRQAMEDIIDAGEQNIARDIETGKSIPETLKSQVLPRFWTMGSRNLPPIVGAAIGGPAGALAGTALAATMGNPTQIIKNMINNASVQRAAALGMGQLARPLSGVEAPLMRAAPLAGAAAGAQFQPLQQYLSPEDEAALVR